MTPDEIVEWIIDDCWELWCDARDALQKHNGDKLLRIVLDHKEGVTLHSDAGSTEHFKLHPLRDL